MVSLALEQTSQSTAPVWEFVADTVGAEEASSFITIPRKKRISPIDIPLDFGCEPYKYKKDCTSRVVLLANLLAYEEYFEEIDAPLMLPKKEFKTKVIVKSIERGKPSICDDLEIW